MARKKKSDSNINFLFTKDKTTCIQRMFARVKTKTGNVKKQVTEAIRISEITIVESPFILQIVSVIGTFVTSITQNDDKKVAINQH
jgi:hypothetical protein